MSGTQRNDSETKASRGGDPQPDARSGFLASHDHADCKAELALRVIQGRWKLLILRELFEAVRRFSDLQRGLRGVSQKVLTAQLRELEADGVVERTVYPEVPPRVEYALTALGRELIPVLEGLHALGGAAAERALIRARMVAIKNPQAEPGGQQRPHASRNQKQKGRN